MLEQAELAQQGKGIAPGIAHGCGTAWQRPGAQVRGALKAAKAGDDANPTAQKGNIHETFD